MSLPTVDIKGKEYVMVKDRVTEFHRIYKNGAIETKVLNDNANGVIVMQAIVTPDISNPQRIFTGISASNPNKTIEKITPHEVAETSAVGRALAFLGIGIIESIASAEEIAKSEKAKPKSPIDMDSAPDFNI